AARAARRREPRHGGGLPRLVRPRRARHVRAGGAEAFFRALPRRHGGDGPPRGPAAPSPGHARPGNPGQARAAAPRRLVVVPNEVVQACGGWLVAEAAVGSSVVVAVEVAGEGVDAFA